MFLQISNKNVTLHERVITLFVKQLNEYEQDERNFLQG